jgi:hypothetical protein
VTEGDISRAATFAFARRLADPDFRRYLHDHGCREAKDIVIALDHEPVSRVFDRILHRTQPPAVIALRRENEKWGFVFLTVEPAESPGSELIEVGEGATIGMLYDMAVRGRQTFQIPNAWYKQVGIHRLDLAGV